MNTGCHQQLEQGAQEGALTNQSQVPSGVTKKSLDAQ